jgi:uncharacterized protein involved in exopolysaccharide biosynthesis
MEENLRLIKPYLRGFPLILFAMIVAMLGARKYLTYVTPMYESTVKLKLADVSEGVPSSNLFKDLDVFATSNKITAEIEVIKSSVLINKVLDNLDFDLEVYRIGQVRKVELYHQSPFIIQGKFTNPKAYDQRFLLQVHSLKKFTLTCSASGEIKQGTFGQQMELRYGQVTISLNHSVISAKTDFSLVDNYEFEFLSREKLIRKIASHLDVIAVDKDVAVIRINFKSPLAEKASRLVNQIAESYITDYIDTKYRAAQVTVRFLNDRIDEIAKRLDQSEETIQRYRSDRDIINIHQETETDLRKIAQLKIQFANVKMNLSAISELDSYIQAGKSDFLALAPNFEAFTDLLSTEIIKKMKQLQADKKDLLITFTPEDERVKVIDSKIKDLSNYLIESIGNTHKNLQTKHNRLEKEIEEAEKVFIGIPEKEKMLTILNREFEIYQRSYNFLNEKKIEAEIAQAAKIAFHRIISPALPSSVPVSPNRPITIIVSSILAMIGSILFILFIHLAKAKVNDGYTIEKNSLIPIAAQTPYLPNTKQREVHFLREVIQLEMKGVLENKKMIAISSGSHQEGKTFHVENLAKAFALQGRKVLVIDLNDPLVKRGFAPSIESNLDYLNLSQLKSRHLTKVSVEEYLKSFLNDYQLILVDNEPLESETLGLMMMGCVDVNLFILDSRKTPARQIEKIGLLQKEFSLPHVWFVLNRAGYNPNILFEVCTWITQITKPLRSAIKK